MTGKVTIGVITPIYGNTYFNCWVQGVLSLKLSSDFEIEIISPNGSSNVTMARNTCVQGVYERELKIGRKLDWLLWLDGDIDFQIEHLKSMISHGKDAVSGVYFHKGGTYEPVAGYYDIELISSGFPKVSPENIMSNKLVEIDWAGMGFFLMKREVLGKIDYPWFEMFTVPLPRPIKRSGGITINNELLSEDITFCKKIKDLGYKIFLDTSVKLGHVGSTKYTASHFMAMHGIKSE
jgi:hypothetical protein